MCRRRHILTPAGECELGCHGARQLRIAANPPLTPYGRGAPPPRAAGPPNAYAALWRVQLGRRLDEPLAGGIVARRATTGHSRASPRSSGFRKVGGGQFDFHTWHQRSSPGSSHVDRPARRVRRLAADARRLAAGLAVRLRRTLEPRRVRRAHARWRGLARQLLLRARRSGVVALAVLPDAPGRAGIGAVAQALADRLRPGARRARDGA